MKFFENFDGEGFALLVLAAFAGVGVGVIGTFIVLGSTPLGNMVGTPVAPVAQTTAPSPAEVAAQNGFPTL